MSTPAAANLDSAPITTISSSSQEPTTTTIAEIKTLATTTASSSHNYSPAAAAAANNLASSMQQSSASALSSSSSPSVKENPTTMTPAPAPHSEPKQFLFAYGSLICKNSRFRTLQRECNEALPVLVKGLQRSWSYRCRKRGYTAVSVERRGLEHEVNGVLIPLTSPELDLKGLDEREEFYARGLIPVSQISILLLNNADGPYLLEGDSIVWVYENLNSSFENFNTNPKQQLLLQQQQQQQWQTNTLLKQQQSFQSLSSATLLKETNNFQSRKPIAKGLNASQHTPSPECPIPRSYIDVILQGCLSYGHNFALTFISSTSGWISSAYVDDRHYGQKYICDGTSFLAGNSTDGLIARWSFSSTIASTYGLGKSTNNTEIITIAPSSVPNSPQTENHTPTSPSSPCPFDALLVKVFKQSSSISFKQS